MQLSTTNQSLEVDLRIVWFGDEGPQLFDAIINVESSSAFN